MINPGVIIGNADKWRQKNALPCGEGRDQASLCCLSGFGRWFVLRMLRFGRLLLGRRPLHFFLGDAHHQLNAVELIDLAGAGGVIHGSDVGPGVGLAQARPGGSGKGPPL